MERPVNQATVIVAIFAATIAALLALPLFECTAGLFGIERLRCGASLAPMLLFGSLIAIPAVVVIALPLFLFMRHLHWTRWWQIALGAAVSSMLAGLVLALSLKSPPSFGNVGMFCCIGLCAAIVFWLVGVRGNEP
jgi:lysylphosphatidylglycerol synthetase-like protein (DUF2156 family)